MKKYIKDNKILPQNRIILQVENTQIINPSEELLLENGWKVYIKEETLKDVRNKILGEIYSYDCSENVNSFTVNGINAWIDRDTRVSLVNSTNARIKLGETTTALWLNGLRLELDCEMLLTLLAQLEVYALNCYDTTEQHKSNVQSFETIEDIENYDYTLNYPEKINITL